MATEERATRISVSGEIDFGNVGRLRNQLVELIQSEEGDLIVELSRVVFIDSTTIGVLIQAKKRLIELDRDLVLSQPAARVRRILEVAGLADYLGV